MDRIEIDGIDILNPIEGKMDKIIDAFVKFYGEEYRPRIEEKLNGAMIYFVAENKGYASIDYSIKHYFDGKIRKEVHNAFWKEVEGEDASERIDKNFLIVEPKTLNTMITRLKEGGIPFYLDSYLEILGYDIPKVKDYNERQKMLREMLRDETFREKLIQRLEKSQSIWDEKYKDKYEALEKEKNGKLLQVQPLIESRDKIDIEYTNEMGEFFEDNIAQYVDGFEKLSAYEKKRLVGIFSDFLSDKKFVTDYDKKRYVDLFNRFGIFHDSYDEYLDDERLNYILNDDIYKKYHDIVLSLTKKRFFSNPFVSQILGDLQSEGEVYGINGFAKSIYNYIFNNSFVGAFVDDLKIGDKIRTICLLPHGLELDDKTMFHEFNHIVEDENIELYGRLYNVSGFDGYEIGEGSPVLDGDKIFRSSRGESRSRRRYEQLNEVINDYFSIKITEIFHSENEVIGKGGKFVSSYSRAFPLLKDFIEENQDLLIKSRLTGNHLNFANFLGQENFNRLADCVTEFLSFNDIERSHIYESIIDKTDIEKIAELKNYEKFDCDWDEKEKIIVDSFKTVKEISEIARVKRHEQEIETENE